MNPVVDILLPTYNRAESLLQNLEHLKREIQSLEDSAQVRIVISDNASTDDTQKVIASFDFGEVQNVYFRQDENVGLEPNMVFLLDKATAPFILWTGDDDYIADGYLKYCLEKASENAQLGVIISGLSSLHESGEVTNGRVEDFEEKKLEAGFKSAWTFSHLAHQMSGLFMRREDLLEKYLDSAAYRNPYLFIFLTTQRLIDSSSFYAPKYSTKVTVFNEKDWGYNQVGLLDEVFKSYMYFLEELGEEKVSELMIRFSVLHSYRYNIDWRHPMRLRSQFKELKQSTPDIKGLHKGIASHLVKDYILSFRK